MHTRSAYPPTHPHTPPILPCTECNRNTAAQSCRPSSAAPSSTSTCPKALVLKIATS